MMRFPSLTIIACAATLAGPVSAGTYPLSQYNTAVSFTSHWGLFRPQGRFDHLDGQLEFTPGQATQSRVDVTLDMSSLRIGGAGFNKHLLGPDGFDVARWPTAGFRSTKIEITGQGTARMTGDLTLHGVTRGVVMAVTFTGEPAGAAYHFRAVARIRRSEFGLTRYPLIAGDEIELQIETTLAH